MSKFKSTYGFYQIATQVEAVYAVMMPASIHAMLSTMELAITFGLNASTSPCSAQVRRATWAAWCSGLSRRSLRA